ncbi:MAG: hypothetical protein JSS73_14755 [Bacteroidetes bacterium]|nr:hypothetical protein [Bacteroidota bacterium]
MGKINEKSLTLIEAKPVFVFGLFGLIASIIVGAGEFLVHYSANGYRGADNFTWLKDISPSVAVVGHVLMIMGMPLYIFGYYHIYLCLQTGHKVLSKLVLVLGIVAFMTAAIWAGSRLMLIEIVKLGDQHLIDFYKSHYEILVQVLRVLIFFISALWVYIIISTKTIYPKWMAVVNPILILGVVFGVYFLVPSIGSFLVPTAMNVTHLIVFTFSLHTSINSTRYENKF